MKTPTDIIKDIMVLNSNDRAFIVEKLLESLDKPDKDVDTLWEKEVEQRINAYQQGHIKTLTVEEVFSKYLRTE